MERTQPDRCAQGTERSRLVRIRIDVAAYLLDEFRIGIDLDLPFRLSAFTWTKTRPFSASAAAKEYYVLGTGTP